MTTYYDQMEQAAEMYSFSFHTDCRHCVAEGKPCGRAHYEVLAHEWKATESKRTTAKPEKLASEKQLNYIRTLLGKKELTDRKRANRAAKLSPELTAKDASAMIDELVALPWAPRESTSRAAATVQAAQRLEAPEGMHRLDGQIYKVQRAVHGSGKPYAKQLVKSEVTEPAEWIFEYAPGAAAKLSADTLMSLEDAAEFGRVYGVCCVCGRTLTNEASIAAGIGPICSASF